MTTLKISIGLQIGPCNRSNKLGAPKAITAMAHRLARLVYRMLKHGQQYIDKGAEYYEQRNRQQQIEFVRKLIWPGRQDSPALRRNWHCPESDR